MGLGTLLSLFPGRRRDPLMATSAPLPGTATTVALDDRDKMPKSPPLAPLPQGEREDAQEPAELVPQATSSTRASGLGESP